MPLLSLHQNEDGNNQTVLFAVARAMHQQRVLLMQIFYQRGLVCTGGVGCCLAFSLSRIKIFKNAVSFASKNSNIKNAINLKAKKKKNAQMLNRVSLRNLDCRKLYFQ